ncbi:MAG TPA: hypothetical protein VFY82_08675 [Acidimicrobiales bacterium]|nr:hypothetical protein [Acidimicrobiales bacterium]
MTWIDRGRQLRDGAHDARWNVTDLWIASVALGSNLALGEVHAITAGVRDPTRGQYEVLAAALNEHLAASGRDHAVLTWDGSPRATGATGPPSA